MTLLLLPPPSGSSYEQRKSRRFRKVLGLALLGMTISLSVFSLYSFQEQELLASINLSELHENPLHGSFSADELVFEKNRMDVNLFIHGTEAGEIHKLQVQLSELGYGYHLSESADQGDSNLELRVDTRKRQEFLNSIAGQFGQSSQEESIQKTDEGWAYHPPLGGVVLNAQLLKQTLREFSERLQRHEGTGIASMNLYLQQQSVAEESKLSAVYDQLLAITEQALVVRSGDYDEVLDLREHPEWVLYNESGVRLDREQVFLWAQDLAQKLSRPTSTVRIVGTEEVRYKAHKAQVEGEFQEGIRMNADEMTSQLIDAFLNPDVNEVQLRQYEIPVKVMNEMTGEMMDLISVGYSEYSEGNDTNRVHNVETGLKRINYSYIQPGDDISFNRLNGPINGEFQMGYAIFGSGAGKSLGGGICQVSTTFYRALLNLGVPITMRQNHSWDLSYYQAGGYGLDATIFPSVGLDVKAQNDIDSPLFVYSYNRPETEEAFVLVYGKSDGRKVSLEPAEEYIPWYGAKTLKWTQTVELPDGEVKQNQIVSRYRR